MNCNFFAFQRSLGLFTETPPSQSLGWEDPLEKGMATHYGEFHGQRSLVCYSSLGLQRLGHN